MRRSFMFRAVKLEGEERMRSIPPAAHRRHRGARAATTMLIAGATIAAGQALAGPVASASADSGCYGDWCSGQNPMTTGCANDAITVASEDLSGAQLQVRWSPSCQTNWAKWIQYPEALSSDVAYRVAAVQDTGYTQWEDSDSGTGAANDPNYTSSDGSITIMWTPMIYSPVHGVQAVALLDCGDEGLLGSAVDCALNGKMATNFV